MTSVEVEWMRSRRWAKSYLLAYASVYSTAEQVRETTHSLGWSQIIAARGCLAMSLPSQLVKRAVETQLSAGLAESDIWVEYMCEDDEITALDLSVCYNKVIKACAKLKNAV